MTWHEFKARVEEQGVTENTEIAWIDVIGWRRSPVVTRADHGMVIIVQRDGSTA
jgi:ribosomal protein L15E